eukprot:10791795-Lingulodinium_polyedra.AAC.1
MSENLATSCMDRNALPKPASAQCSTDTNRDHCTSAATSTQYSPGMYEYVTTPCKDMKVALKPTCT